MSILEVRDTDGYVFFDEAQARAAGKALAARYQSASPFPHIAIDDFLPLPLLRQVVAEFPDTGRKTSFNREQERLKYQFHPSEVPSGHIRNLLAELNSRAFLGFLEEMTGIGGLIADPYYAGGGLHETKSGGHLSVHADFNIHETMQVERRLNLLVYLNEDWPESYGGNLELWKTDMSACEVSVAPVIGRAVVFNTTLESYHGQPDPIACPPDRARRSIATYYYTALPAHAADIKTRTTTFQVRPGTGDRTDWKVKTGHLIGDWVPPRLQRYAHRLNPFR